MNRERIEEKKYLTREWYDSVEKIQTSKAEHCAWIIHTKYELYTAHYHSKVETLIKLIIWNIVKLEGTISIRGCVI